ncbi:MAG TPA: SBBP repeat-containing protein, partial [Chthonomonadales bacterium]|nr:SBBP repeat-containing protein [Chthonomonadales bacterium]
MYVAIGTDFRLLFGERQITLLCAKPSAGKAVTSQVALTFPGSMSNPQIQAAGRLPGVVSYLAGNDPSKWKRAIPTYARIRYHNLYPGVDVEFYGSHSGIEYDIIAAPGADISRVKMALSGSEELRQSHSGELVASLPGNGSLRMKLPRAYQTAAGVEHPVAAKLTLAGRQIGIRVTGADRSRPVVIDPVLFVTYLGGSTTDYGYAITVDAQGNSYITGTTFSSNFPTHVAFQSTINTGPDAYITKFNSAGVLIYSTFLGGSAADVATAIAVDASGNAYITGYTTSTDFPVLNAFNPVNSGSYDAFLTKLDPTGSTLLYSTYFGGTANDIAYGVAVNSTGEAAICGSTNSTDIPASGYQNACGGGFDGLIAAFDTTKSGLASLIYASYLGGSGTDEANGIAIDRFGNVYVAGDTTSSNFPTTPGALETSLVGSRAGFITRFSTRGSNLDYSTYLCCQSQALCHAIAIDGYGNAYVAGQAGAGLPTTFGAFQPYDPG